MPSLIEPQLATLVSRPPGGDDSSYEIKFDGYRLMVRVEDRAVALFTRNGHDWSARMPHLIERGNTGRRVEHAARRRTAAQR
jgi:bifunctional non-homologous end joining protein LigD